MIPFEIVAGLTMASSAMRGIAGSAAAKSAYSAQYRQWQEQELQNQIAIRQFNRQAARSNEEMRTAYVNTGKALAEENSLELQSILAEKNAAINHTGSIAGDLMAKNMALAEAKGAGGDSGMAKTIYRVSALNALNSMSTIKLNSQRAALDANRKYQSALSARQYHWTAPRSYIPGYAPAAPNTGNIMAGALIGGAMQVGMGALGSAYGAGSTEATSSSASESSGGFGDGFLNISNYSPIGSS